SGRIPSAHNVTPAEQSTLELKLALQHAGLPTHANCRPLRGTERILLPAFHKLTLRSGTASIVYVPADGVRSASLQFQPNTSYIAAAGPLPLEIEPGLKPALLCRD